MALGFSCTGGCQFSWEMGRTHGPTAKGEKHATFFWERENQLNERICWNVRTISSVVLHSFIHPASLSVDGHVSLSMVFCSQYQTSWSLWRDWLTFTCDRGWGSSCFALNPRRPAVQTFTPVLLLPPLKCNLCSLRNISWLFAAVQLHKAR